MSLKRVYIGLGSNLESPILQLQQALSALHQIPGCQLEQCSSFYRTAPVGPQDQSEFINAVAAVMTELEPLALLDALQQIEWQQGRRREQRWGPRTLDLDILLYADRQIADARLQVPHPQIPMRSFVLIPLAEIADSGLAVPGMGTLQQLLSACPYNPIEKLQTAEMPDVAAH